MQKLPDITSGHRLVHAQRRRLVIRAAVRAEDHVHHRRDDPDYAHAGEQHNEEPGRGRVRDQHTEERVTERRDPQEALPVLHPFVEDTHKQGTGDEPIVETAQERTTLSRRHAALLQEEGWQKRDEGRPSRGERQHGHAQDLRQVLIVDGEDGELAGAMQREGGLGENGTAEQRAAGGLIREVLAGSMGLCTRPR